MVSDVNQKTPTTDYRGISVRSLWKVFGKNPVELFNSPLRNMEKSTIQRDLNLVVALRDVSFDVTPGETFVVMGLSGSGKSTLVRCLINLIEPTSGSIIVDGQDITQFDQKELRDFRRSKIAMVFQNFGLLPHKNVLDNAAYGLEVKGIEKHERYELAREVLAKVGLEGWETSNQRELSGGMQQRVGLARALAMDPSILLMDEPFSGLDPLIRRQMRTELSTLQQEIQKTIIFITHDLDEAITVGDRIAIMRDGEIIQLGTPEDIITNPVDSFVEEFTEGIPKTKIINISNIISEASTFTLPTSTADILGLMDQKQSDYAVSVDQFHKYLGMVARDDMNITSNDSITDISDILKPTLQPIHPDTTLEAALTVMSRETLAVPVTDSSNTFLGMVTPQDLLRTLANSQ